MFWILELWSSRPVASMWLQGTNTTSTVQNCYVTFLTSLFAYVILGARSSCIHGHHNRQSQLNNYNNNHRQQPATTTATSSNNQWWSPLRTVLRVNRNNKQQRRGGGHRRLATTEPFRKMCFPNCLLGLVHADWMKTSGGGNDVTNTWQFHFTNIILRDVINEWKFYFPWRKNWKNYYAFACV